MEARRGRVEADIGADDVLGGERVQRRGVGQLVDVAALVEQLEEGRIVRGHDRRLASLTCSCYTLAMQLNLVPHPETPPSEPFKLWVNVDHSGSFGAIASTNLWFCIGAAPGRFVIPETIEEPARTEDLWETTCFEAFLRQPRRECLSRMEFRALGQLGRLRFHRRIATAAARARSAPPYIRVEDNITWWAAWRDHCGALEEEFGARALRHPRREGRHQILLGAQPSCGRQARFPRRRLLRRAPALISLHDPVRYRSAACRSGASPPARRQARSHPRPSRLCHPRPHAQRRRAGRGRPQADGGVRAPARPARRQAGQYGGVPTISPIRSTRSRSSASMARCAARPASRWGLSTRS